MQATLRQRGLAYNGAMDSPQEHAAVGVIAVDGPGAVGKTTVGRALAERLGYRFVDTGIMYRAVTVLALETGVDTEDDEALTALAGNAELNLRPGQGRGAAPVICAGDRDLTEAITGPDVDRAVSRVSAVAGVRRELVALQRSFAGEGRVVMVGRDIGTVVLPDAPLKIYLDASPEERARRRFEERRGRGESVSYEDVFADLVRRDGLDSGRDLSPLTAAADARRIDTTSSGVEDVVDEIVRIAEGRIAAGP